MILEESRIWLTLEQLIRLLVQDRYGHITFKGHGITLVKKGGWGFLNPDTVIRAEVREALERGRLTAYGEPRGEPSGDAKHRVILPVEWVTISLYPFWPGHFGTFRVRREEVEDIWPRLSSKSLFPTDKPNSPFRAQAAREMFRRNSGWQNRSQGHAARELAAIYSTEFKSLPQPSISTFVHWVRDWSIIDGIDRRSVRG